MNDEHVMASPPSIVTGEGFKILLVDMLPGVVVEIAEAIKPSPMRVILYVYQPEDDEPEWATYIANLSDLIIVNAEISTKNDLIKGNLISNSNACYTGGQAYKTVWDNHTYDPVGLVLKQLEEAVRR